jgi:RsiW-degrading membrane proteinase PrsW (M82 family)
MTYSFIDAGVLALRLKKAPTKSGVKFNQMILKWCPWTFMVFSLLSAFGIANKWDTEMNVILGVCTLLNYAIIQIYITKTEQYTAKQESQFVTFPPKEKHF